MTLRILHKKQFTFDITSEMIAISCIKTYHVDLRLNYIF